MTSFLAAQNFLIHLAPDGAMRPYAVLSDHQRNAARIPELLNGRVLALHGVSGPHDVHYPAWELHPEGDELLLLACGSLSVEVRKGETTTRVPLSMLAPYIIPSRTWHRLIVHKPSVLIAVTPPRNTVHRKDCRNGFA